MDTFEGLTTVGVANEDIGYEFNQFWVWANADGKLYWTWTAGCSCSYPCEEIDGIEDLDTGSFSECHLALEEWAAGSDERLAEATDLHLKIAGIRS